MEPANAANVSANRPAYRASACSAGSRLQETAEL
jgi:hypothetical protein